MFEHQADALRRGFGLDADTLRRAVDVACGACGHAPPGRVSTVYKVLTPGAKEARVSLDALAAAKYDLVIWNGIRVLRHPDDGRTPFAPDFGERLRIAYRFALARTADAPEAELAEFSLFYSGLHMLDPGEPAGKRLRDALGKCHEWMVVGHTPSQSAMEWMRPKDGWDGAGLQEDQACEAGVPGAFKVQARTFGQRRLYVRPRSECEMPHSVSLLIAEGGRRHGWVSPRLDLVWARIGALPSFLVEDGARLEVRRGRDGSVQAVASFSRARNGWLLENGQRIPAEHGERDAG